MEGAAAPARPRLPSRDVGLPRQGSECGIGVAVRMRPMNAREEREQAEGAAGAGAAVAAAVGSTEPCWAVRGGEGGRRASAIEYVGASSGEEAAAGSEHRQLLFNFDHVLGPEADTASVYEKLCGNVVSGTLEGYNGTIFAYGQTSSGKTHSMVGAAADPGMAVLAVHDIFDMIERNSDSDFLVFINYIEIYNERINDLLGGQQGGGPGGDDKPQDKPAMAWSNHGGSGTAAQHAADRQHGHGGGLEVFEDKQRGPYVKGATEVVCCSPEMVLEQIRRGLEGRHMAATEMNQASSRSHTILRVVVESRRTGEHERQKGGGGRLLTAWDTANSATAATAAEADALAAREPVRMSSLYLVDLAGSENASRHRDMQRLKEGSHINKSLLTLSKVINMLAREGGAGGQGGDINRGHVPYRDSKLTRLLSTSLGGNSRTVLLCCISPAACCFDETRSTLQFGERAKRVRNKVRVNYLLTY
jgi:centromeric protein E